LPQALVLTAIVISFGMTAFVIVLALKARAELGNDHVDGIETGHEKIHDTRRHNEIGDTRQRDKGGVKPRRDKGGDTRHREDAR
jgi:multicomponent K+:H+ antiporter subunit C